MTDLETNTSICYLCGDTITDAVSWDHVPPKHFFPKMLRKKENPNLLTLPTHETCNNRFSRDEEYFYQSVSPLAWDTRLGPILKEDLARRYKREAGIRLGQMVLEEFDQKPGGLYLPSGYVAKRIDAKRGSRIIWKIARGLHYYELDKYLPATVPHSIDIHAEDSLPERYAAFQGLESRRQYPGIFDYRYWCEDTEGEVSGCIWGLRFWRKIFAAIAYRLP